MDFDRRQLLAGLAAAAASASAIPNAFAQAALTAEQQAEYARQFRVGAATGRELSILRDIQERRSALPPGLENFSRFIADDPSFRAMRAGLTPQLGMLKTWHDLSLVASSMDHTTDGSSLLAYSEQLGPARASRALAIIHIAIFEAINTIFQRFSSYMNMQQQILAAVGIPSDRLSPTTASVSRAIIEAGFETIVALYPNKRPFFEVARAQSLVLVGDDASSTDVGERIGKAAASIILAIRQTDGSQFPDLSADDLQNDDPLGWQKDPISQLGPALGGNWHRVKPFVISSADAFRPVAPPDATDPAFIAAFKDVKQLGGDPNAEALFPRWPTPTTRTGVDPNTPLDANNETFKGIFWGYDGTANLCAPPRLYNMIATSIALGESPVTGLDDFARLLALLNIAMADAGIGAWEAKYHYLYARPVTTIRNYDADNTPEGSRNENWTPLGAPVTNGRAENRNLTPPFPSYPSGHATFGGAVFQILRRFFAAGPDGLAFQFISDEYNGVNRGPGDVNPRPERPRQFTSFTQAEIENAQSRIWLGIHWQFDADRGIEQGQRIADEVFDKILM